MKKLLAFALLWCVALTACGAVAEASAAPGADAPVTVAIDTRASGCFYSDMWGVNMVDANVRALVHGYSTVAWSFTGQYGIDPGVVRDFTTAENDRGDRTYRFTLAQGLCYNDGTPITAADYVFTVLLESDPAVAALGGLNTAYSYLRGYTNYAQGKAGVFAGVRLLGAYEFSLTVPVGALPYFYEMTYAQVEPTPIGVLAPGYEVRDDGRGAYLAAEDGAGTAPAASPLTAELLAETLTGESGYLYAPRVTCGAYQLAAFDAETGAVSLTANPRYAGNAEGRKPELTQVTIVPMENDAALAAYQEGSVQIIHNITDPAVVEAARQLSIAGTAQVGNHLNSGYAYLSFACEQAPTDDVNVRKAIAMCVDRAAFCAGLYQNNALPVYGYYGYAQWMVQLAGDEMAMYDLGYDVESARVLLEEAGYKYNEDGEPFVEGRGQTRCKLSGGVLTPLALRWAKTASPSADLLKTQLTTAFEKLGVALTIEEMSFPELLGQYYRADGTRQYQLFFLSEMFPYKFDPYYAYNVADAWQGAFNTTGLADARLMRAALNLRRVENGDMEGYLAKWKTFQQRWNEAQPTVPIYCTVELDVCGPTLYRFLDYVSNGLDIALMYATYTAQEPTPEPTLDSTATPAP